MTRIKIVRSVLPNAKIYYPVPLRVQTIQNAEEQFFHLLMKEKEQNGGISTTIIKEFFKRLFPNKKINIFKNVDKNAGGEEEILINQKGQVRGFNFKLSGIKNKFCKLNNELINNDTHEFNHLIWDILNPNITAAQYSINRAILKKPLIKNLSHNQLIKQLNKRIETLDNTFARIIYSTELSEKEYEKFCQKYKLGGKIKEKAIEKRIDKVKQRYSKAIDKLTPIVEDEKIKTLKMHIRSLESEQRAYEKGNYFYAKATYENLKDKYSDTAEFMKDMTNFKNSMQEENHMDYLIPEKIQMLKTIYFEEIAKTREAHRLNIQQNK